MMILLIGTKLIGSFFQIVLLEHTFIFRPFVNFLSVNVENLRRLKMLRKVLSSTMFSVP